MGTLLRANDQLAFSFITFTSDDAIYAECILCCNFYYSNQLDSAVLNTYLWTESERNVPLLDAFSGLFYTQNVFAAGAPHGRRWRSLQRSPRPPSW